ncbi:MAG: TetR/AcrR family transcriptional regulator [Spirochaetia bacterium]|nr:TetR/AcrR family transcriptional regulator [Spirochaetia bacterium]
MSRKLTIEKRILIAAMELFVKRRHEEVNVSELAKIAGVARGTIYNNFENLDTLLDAVTNFLTQEMNTLLEDHFQVIPDPARRVSMGIRLYIQRAKDEPLWGEFLCKFGLENTSLRELLVGPFGTDIRKGLSEKRFHFKQDQLKSIVGFIGSTVLFAIHLVNEGDRTWVEAGSDCAEFSLRSLGVHPEEAKKIASEKMIKLDY